MDTISLNPLSEINIYNKYSFFVKMLNNVYSEMIDTHFSFIPSALCKIPFTVANYSHAQYICLPIPKKWGLEKFNLEDYNINNLFKYSTRKYEFAEYNRVENGKKFIKLFDFVFNKFNDNMLKSKKGD